MQLEQNCIQMIGSLIHGKRHQQSTGLLLVASWGLGTADLMKVVSILLRGLWSIAVIKSHFSDIQPIEDLQVAI